MKQEDACVYDLSLDSLCGAALVSHNGFLMGMHVAGLPEEKIGVINLLSKTAIKVINGFFKETNKFPVEIDPNGTGNCAFLTKKHTANVVTHTQLVPSMVDGIYPKERIPAFIVGDPLEKLKELSNASLVETTIHSIESNNFIVQYLKQILEDWNPRILSEHEIVCGNEHLCAIDKKSSVGYGLLGEKRDYLNYEEGKFSPILNDIVNDFEGKIHQGVYPEFYFKEQFKDELRDLAKADKPRIFRGAPLVHTVLIRKYLGSLVEFFGQEYHRLNTGIMVGINPFSDEWCNLIREVIKHGNNVFDGDFSKFDKKMLPTFQQLICKVIKSKLEKVYDSSQLETSDFLLNSIIYNPVLRGNDSFITTHSLPSGCGLTAHFNSLIHKAYMAYAFFILFKNQHDGKEPTLYDYTSNVYNAVYGDDGLTGVSPQCKEYFNGPAVQQVMLSIGLDYTPGDKKQWNYSTRSYVDCTFLKRRFTFHRKLCKIVAPLDLVSMKSTLNYVKDEVLNEEMTAIKLQNFQREAYLHEEYDDLMQYVKTYCKESSFNVSFMPEEYLMELYKTGKFVDYLILQ